MKRAPQLIREYKADLLTYLVLLNKYTSSRVVGHEGIQIEQVHLRGIRQLLR